MDLNARAVLLPSLPFHGREFGDGRRGFGALRQPQATLVTAGSVITHVAIGYEGLVEERCGGA
jgi:hypothetical protein